MSNPIELTDPVLDASDGPTKLLLAVEYWKQQVKYQISHNKELDRQIDDLKEYHQQLIAEIEVMKQANSDLAKAAIVPDGMVLVPREPTGAMVEACCNSMDRGFAFEYVANAYKAMINAAREYKG